MNLDTFIHQSPYSNIAYNVDGVYFFLNEEWKKIAINVSGGADSAMLTFILCKIISENNLDIEIVALSHLRLWKTRPWQIYDARRVIAFIKQCYPTVKITHHENFMAPELNCKDPVIEDENGHMKTGDRVQVRAWNDYMCYINQIPAWFGGITLNPTDNLITQKPFDRNKEFEYSEEDLKKLIRHHNGVYICHPFSFTDKEWIMQQYKNFDRIDLLKLTHSCEGDDNLYPEVYQGLDYRTYVPDQIVPECDKCFWCQERHWGMKKVFGEIIKR